MAKSFKTKETRRGNQIRHGRADSDGGGGGGGGERGRVKPDSSYAKRGEGRGGKMKSNDTVGSA